MQVISIILFFLVGLAFGYALGPPMMWIPVLFPITMALAASLKDGPSGSIVLRVAIVPGSHPRGRPSRAAPGARTTS